MSDLDDFFAAVEGGPSLPAPGASGGAGGVGGPASADDMREFLSDATVPDAPADDLLQRLHGLLQQHTKQLNDMRETLSDSTSEAFRDDQATVRINMEPYDGVPILSMVHTDNAQFNKVTLVFAYLCDEIRVMKAEAAQKFYGPLTMFGHEFSTQTDDAEADAAVPGVAKPAPPPPAEKQTPELEMGAFLPLLQELTNFVRRLHSLARNLVNQLACLYHERQKMWLSTFRHVHLELPFHALGELCGVLFTLDSIVADNPNLALFWTQFKRMVKYVRAQPEQYGMGEPIKMRLFENMLLQIDRVVLSANMYGSMLEMDFGLQQAVTGGAAAPNGTGGPSTAATLIAGNKVLYATLNNFMHAWFKRLSSGVGETVETYPRQLLVECYALYGLQRALFRSTVKPDKSFFTALWVLQRKVPLIPLFGRACFFVADFLGRYAPVDLRNLVPSGKGIVALRGELLQAHDETFASKTEELYNQLAVWMVRMESELAPSAQQGHGIATVLHARAKLLLNGLLLANQLRNHVLVNLHLHLHLRESFRSRNIRSYALVTEMLKAIQLTFSRRTSMLSEHLGHMVGQTSFTIKQIVVPVKRKVEQAGAKGGAKIAPDAAMDVAAATHLALELLDQPPTRSRMMLLDFALSIVQFDGLLKDLQQDELKYQVWKLEQLATHQSVIEQSTDTSYVYWISNLVPAIFQDMFNLAQDQNQVQRMQYLFLAFNDCAKTLFNGGTGTGQQQAAGAAGAAGGEAVLVAGTQRQQALALEYRTEILSHFTTHILNPLCREVETDLRLHIHSVVLQQANLRTGGAAAGPSNGRTKDLSKFLNLPSLRFFDSLIDIRARVTHYLDSIFYNLNTVALHDWRIYAEMRNLAHEKYGLDMTEVHLPGTAHFSEALDVLEIMRNIHIFVSRYNYNMNTQIFVERAFDQKHLNTINIYHISDSLRTHGTGISTTTVNFTYQFLVRKFKIFSEFLFDDHIKSRLIKQVRSFRLDQQANAANGGAGTSQALGSGAAATTTTTTTNTRMFPYSVADKFTRDIRKLGVAEDGTTFLDQFRKQITEIGNALGYVRMVRSGGLHHVSQSVKFVPNSLDELPSFAANAVKENLSPESVEAARNLDTVLGDLVANFSDGSEYFAVLVKIFESALRHPSQGHLGNFYAIIPALTLNFVERMVGLKEKLGKTTGRHEAAFTDDGFALGLAYILRILDQHAAFNSLHWFESVNEHMAQRRGEGARLRAQMAAGGKGGSGGSGQKGAAATQSARVQEEEILAHGVAMKKLALVQTEFDLFFYSFSGATIFFQGDGSDGGDATGVEGAAKEAPKEGAAAAAPGAPAADGSVPPVAPPAPSDVPVPPPMDAGSFVSSSAAPPAPPMLPGADGAVLGVGAPPAPPPDF